MKTYCYLSVLASCLLLATFSRAISQTPEVPVKATVCQLLSDRKAWDHKLVEVTGFASHGFEDSNFYDPTCPGRYDLWMDYGGKLSTGTMSTVSNSNRTRPVSAVVEGIAVPVVDDALFHRFDDFLHQDAPMGINVHATVVARFFAGRILHYPDGDLWGGYGHLGCCSLFVIQQVLNVDDQRRPDLDYSDTPEQPSCHSFQGVMNDTQTQPLTAQHRAEQGEQAYAFTNDHDVAVAAMKSSVNDLKADDLTLKVTSHNSYRSVYLASVRGSASSYMIVLSRPYWLSFYAADPAKVAWVVLALYRMPCSVNGSAAGSDHVR